eukprot:CAMPEP_0172306318 /NCGR_PEP_ID=MMETSP1058-20130122/7411_1 /TAXON_ID=83371 /ORGANISM="Detonula confervacea, Strain CCMP 353" /LENGTH=1113 /DNA_ID=CAMNT_0013018159 /DNA_START=164 /DNA_END=3502 /DNA_ORIENTATION=-
MAKRTSIVDESLTSVAPCRRRNMHHQISPSSSKCNNRGMGYRFKRGSWIGCDNCMSNGRRRIVSTRQKATKLIFIWACAALSISTNFFYIAEASSNSGSSSGNAPFLVMSEITVQSSDDGNHADANNNIQSSAVGSNQKDSGSADDTSANNEDGVASSDMSVNQDVSTGETSSTDEQIMSGGGGSSGSDTDGEDDDELDNDKSMKDNGSHRNVDGEFRPEIPSALTTPTSESATASQPLRTLKRLQAMLDDTDYATHTVASATAIASTTRNVVDVENASQSSSHNKDPSQIITQTPSSSSTPNTSTPLSPEKLWTSKDRAKYRRTRRTEKQRQQQHQQALEEQHARKIRDIQRQRIIREERENKELEELRRKQAEVMEQQRFEEQKRQRLQQQFLHLDEATDCTDDDTDTDGKGFELPNLPVYLSDAETDDFSEEADKPQKVQQPRPVLPSNYSPPKPQQGYQKMPPRQNVAQNVAQPYQYNYPEAQQNQQPHQPPPQTNAPYQNYQQYPPYSQQQQQQQQQQTMPQYQYGHNQQQMQDNQRKYEQLYAAWAQAAANGYYYPPPPHPSAGTPFQPQQAQTHQQSQQQAQQPPGSSYTHQYPYVTQQNQGASYATHSQHAYHTQQQGGPSQSSTTPHSTIPPQQASFPPRPHASSTYQGSGAFLNRKNEVGDEQSVQQQQQQQQLGSQNNNGGAATPNNANDLTPAATKSALIDPTPVPETDTTTSSESKNSTTTSSSSVGQMGVKSAFVSSPTSSLISRVPFSSKEVVAPINAEGPYCELVDESDVLIAGTESRISFDSIQKLSFSTIAVALLAYCAVSPRSLPFPEYNRLFLQNISIVWLAAIAPIVSLLAVYDVKYNNINTAIGTFHVSFTLGYALAFISEIVVTTVVRLGVFKIWEPAIFSLTPKVPSIILPWVLREKQYKPKRITLFAADFGASCVASPIIEEYLKLKVVQWTCKLPRNFKQNRKVQKGKRRRKQNTLQPVRSIDAPQVTNINCYVTQMLAASLGLKLFDVTRRILMYTKEADDYKRIYAVCRGTFPIHELCGTMTALLLARRDVTGVNLPQWKILSPAVFIHGMANFRGMKPIFKWNSSTPWSEMQLNQLKKDNDFIW